jgi:hypothetical protein
MVCCANTLSGGNYTNGRLFCTDQCNGQPIDWSSPLGPGSRGIVCRTTADCTAAGGGTCKLWPTMNILLCYP